MGVVKGPGVSRGKTTVSLSPVPLSVRNKCVRPCWGRRWLQEDGVAPRARAGGAR